jgi:hypothetical protein
MEVNALVLTSGITVILIVLAYLGAELGNREHEKEIRRNRNDIRS